MRRYIASLALVGICATTARAVVVESYELGVINVHNDGAAESPTIEESNQFPTDGVASAKYTLNANWAWQWNYHNVTASIPEILANQYLAFDFTVASGQVKFAGMAANSNTSGWKQQDAWSDAIAPPGTPGQILQLPTWVAGENRGYGVFVTGSTGTVVWDYKAAGFVPGVSDGFAQFSINMQGTTSTVIHLDNLRVLSAPPQPPQYIRQTIYSWETPDTAGTPANEQLEGWTQGSPGFGENQHIHSISTLGATDGAHSLQIDRQQVTTGFTWGSQVAIQGGPANPGNQARIDQLVAAINQAEAIEFDVRFDDSFPNTPTFTIFGMYVSDGTSFFDGQAQSINGVQTIGTTRTVTIPLSSLDTTAGVKLSDAGLAAGTTGLGFGISVNTDGAGIYQIDNVRLVIPEPDLTADFDGDGDVDGQDLADWRTSFGSGPGADADGDGDSDGSDFLVWQRELGGGASLGTLAAIPEPSSCLLAVAALGLCWRRR